MKFLNILKYPDPALRIKAQNVGEDELRNMSKFAKYLAYTMYKAEGVGLASTQVGINKRVIVIDVSKKFDENYESFLKNQDILFLNKNLIIAINPEIIYREGKITHEEGCLSVPEFNADIERSNIIKVKALGLNGKEFITEADGILSIAFQHEIDHLDGILFIDKVSPLKRTLYNAKLKKLKIEEKVY
ncbi:MAG: peptide deformylase [bacterium]